MKFLQLAIISVLAALASAAPSAGGLEARCSESQ